jgi:hypothetical protein
VPTLASGLSARGIIDIMQPSATPAKQNLPWYLWPLVPFAFLAALSVMLPLGVLALISIPFFWLYPDRHMQFADLEGTPEEKARVARWRAAYNRLSFFGRVRRSIRRTARRRWRRRHSAADEPNPL